MIVMRRFTNFIILALWGRCFFYSLRTLLLLAFVFCLPFFAFAQPVPTQPTPTPLPNISRYGYDGFRLLLQQQRLEVLQTTLGEGFADPAHTVLVIVGDTIELRQHATQIEDFARDGGAVLVATDIGNIELFRTTINRGPVLVTPEHAYQGQRDCPIVTNLEKRNPLFEGVEELVTNISSFVARRSNSPLRPIARFPRSFANGMASLMVANKGQIQGRMLVVADHSLFVNEMLLHGDNSRFVANVAKWLCADSDRYNLIFIQDGEVMPPWSFDQNEVPIPLDELLRRANQEMGNIPFDGETFVDFSNRVLTKLEDENVHNEALTGIANSISRKNLRQFLVLGAMGLAMLVLTRRFTRSNPKLSGWQRRKAVRTDREPIALAAARRKQLGPSLRLLAREFFLQFGSPDQQMEWQNSTPPRIVGELTQKHTKSLCDLWNVASQQQNPEISANEFEKRVAEIHHLQQLQRQGHFRLEWGSS